MRVLHHQLLIQYPVLQTPCPTPYFRVPLLPSGSDFDFSNAIILSKSAVLLSPQPEGLLTPPPPCQGYFRAHLLEFMDHLLYSPIKRRIRVCELSPDFKVQLEALDVLQTTTFENAPDPPIKHSYDVRIEWDPD